jgi:hypothetical protein
MPVWLAFPVGCTLSRLLRACQNRGAYEAAAYPSQFGRPWLLPLVHGRKSHARPLPPLAVAHGSSNPRRHETLAPRLFDERRNSRKIFPASKLGL